MEEFKVVKLTKTKDKEAKNALIMTIANETEIDLGFAKQTVRKRFCLGVDSTDVKVGDELKLDLAKFDCFTLDSEVVDENTGELTTIRTKWLKYKAN